MTQPLGIKKLPDQPRFAGTGVGKYGIIFILQKDSANRPLVYSYLCDSDNNLLSFPGIYPVSKKKKELCEQTWDSMSDLGIKVVQLRDSDIYQYSWDMLKPGDVLIKDDATYIIGSVGIAKTEDRQHLIQIRYFDIHGKEDAFVAAKSDLFAVIPAKQDTIYGIEKI